MAFLPKASIFDKPLVEKQISKWFRVNQFNFDYSNDGFDYNCLFIVAQLCINNRIETKTEIKCVFL